MLVATFSKKPSRRVAVALLLAIGLALWLVMRYFSPSPPSVIDMTTGAVDGASHQFALQYQRYLAANRVTLRLLPSTGAVQNLERLGAGTPVGFVQGGLGTQATSTADVPLGEGDTPLRSLGVVGYEPVWIFAAPGPLATALRKGLGALAGKKVAIGAEGSGTRKVALELLQSYAVSPANAALTAGGGLAAADALLARSLDAVIIIGAPQAAAVQRLLADSRAALVSIDHAEGLTRRLPYLSLVTLKAGSVNPAADTPSQDITLLTTTANLVIRDDLHPALAYLLLEAARQVHASATLLSRPGEFPHPRATDFPLAEEAQRYYRDGRPLLQRWLPYWAANALQRWLLVLVPLLAIAIPVVKVIPALFDFKERNRLFQHYAALLSLEHTLRQTGLSPAQISSASARLDTIERAVKKMKFSLDFSDRVYTLRQHVDYVRGQLERLERLARLEEQGPGDAVPPAA